MSGFEITIHRDAVPSLITTHRDVAPRDTSAVGGAAPAPAQVSPATEAPPGSAAASLGGAIDSRSMLGNTFWNIGAVAAIGGSVIASIGAFAGAVAEEGNMKAGASSQDSQAVMDDLGATQARIAAQDVVRQGAKRKGRYQLRAAQEQGSQRASAAARGIVGGVGSQAEVQAGLKYAQEVDELTIDSNTLRQRQALERQELSLRNRARMRRVSAENMRRSAGAISPGLAAASQALRGLASVGGGFAQRFS